MKLLEIFNKNIDFKIIQEDEDEFHTQINIGSNLIQFDAELMNKENDKWMISFGKEINSTNSNKKYFSVEITKDFQEFKVFNFVKSSFEYFLNSYKPRKLIFSSDKKDASRFSLYKKLVNKFLSKDYDISLSNNSFDEIFTLTRKEK